VFIGTASEFVITAASEFVDKAVSDCTWLRWVGLTVCYLLMRGKAMCGASQQLNYWDTFCHVRQLKHRPALFTIARYSLGHVTEVHEPVLCILLQDAHAGGVYHMSEVVCEYLCESRLGAQILLSNWYISQLHRFVSLSTTWPIVHLLSTQHFNGHGLCALWHEVVIKGG